MVTKLQSARKCTVVDDGGGSAGGCVAWFHCHPQNSHSRLRGAWFNGRACGCCAGLRNANCGRDREHALWSSFWLVPDWLDHSEPDFSLSAHRRERTIYNLAESP